jgi:large subunit ribosomal protein L23
MKTPFEILLKPILTEKLTAQEDKLNRYGFMVERTANKIQIKNAVEEMYGVTVDAVNTMRYAGKNKSRFTKAGVIAGRGNHFKKAMITLRKGEKIDFYSSI